ncbi:hypothetical protein SASPL_154259 [Salvia splendens]|uniref:Uncharacterized protein n=1 Tax=Salvia splendens TaxID=180675 RepID=A0A8X8YZ46_SALSN|nr:uncharacterized protein LOC121786705 [Salvia splendens]KAG6385424.1 hypothetical protein SASPL_154259 [Salvia splendens]
MTLTRSLLRSSFFFFRRRRPRSNAGRRTSPFFRRRSAAADNPEPSSPKVTCIGQVRVKSQKKVKQCRRRINGESSFRSASEPSFHHWVHLPSFSALLREFCCLFSCKCGGCETWWCGGGRRKKREIIAVKCGGDEEEEEEEVISNPRKHVFDDIEVNGDRIEVKGRSFEDEFAISVPPKNALLLMRCRSDPVKLAAIANRISSDAARYENVAFQFHDEEEDDDETSSSDEVFEARVLEQVQKEMFANEAEKSFMPNNERIEPEEDVESNMSSFEALLETENEPKSDPIADQKQEINQEKGALPECLLLMMREPKLSMEVSKETWVCATDFIRLHPERPRRAAAKADAEPPLVKKRVSVEKSKPRVPAPPKRNNDAQPARSSCSLPPDGKCEPLVLTRCKSEPMSSAAAKLMPEAGC